MLSHSEQMIFGGYRTYQSTHAIFLKKDSYTPFRKETTANGFNYVNGNPVLFVDKTGHVLALAQRFYRYMTHNPRKVHPAPEPVRQPQGDLDAPLVVQRMNAMHPAWSSDSLSPSMQPATSEQGERASIQTSSMTSSLRLSEAPQDHDESRDFPRVDENSAQVLPNAEFDLPTIGLMKAAPIQLDEVKLVEISVCSVLPLPVC